MRILMCIDSLIGLWHVLCILKRVDAVVGLRVETEKDVQGVDVKEHCEAGSSIRSWTGSFL